MDSLETTPTIVADQWEGYQHFIDQTLQPFNTLAFPSRNCTMPSRDKVVPDKGKTLLGQQFTQDQPIIGNMQKFTTMGGVELEVRVWHSDQYLEYTGLTGVFTIGEVVTGGSSGSTGVVASKDTDKIILKNVTGAFTIGETITGGTSGATAIVSVEHTTYADVIEILYTDTNPSGAFYNIPHWYQITQNVNPFLSGVHRYSFDQWFDTNIDPALSLNLSRLIWVNGLPTIFSWTGGIAPIISMVANVSITTTAGVNWASLGFVSPALGGSGNIVINGKVYAITGGWDTNTLTLSSTTGISVGDLAFSQIEQDPSTSTGAIPFDFCKQNKNYMFYGYWKDRRLFMSNAFNHPSTLKLTAVQATQNDLVIGTSLFTGTGEHVYRVTIDSVNPPQNTQEYISGGVGGLNDGVYDYSGYTLNDGITHIYKVSMLADFLITTSIVGGIYTVGETLTGLTSGAQGLVVAVLTGSDYTYGLRMISTNVFQSGEEVSGNQNAFLNTVDEAQWQNWIQYSKDGIVINIDNGSGSIPITPLNTSLTDLSDGLTITFANFFGHAVGDIFQLTMNMGGSDTFQWQIDGGIPVQDHVAITGSNQTLDNGIEISFVSKTGHTIGDYWEITADQAITEAWHNYYYTLPIRKPGEGFIYRLPSNFWTMDTQEDKLYVNCQYGEWSTVDSELSSDLASETISLSPLKQSGALKVIDPWMTGHLEDDLMFVTLDKSLMSIGRKEFLQEPQNGYLSDPVKLDFQLCSFVGGGIRYIDKRLHITSPEQGIMHVYDVAKKYWQAPKTFIEMGIPSVVLNQLIVHSNLRNQSFTMFTNENGDNGMNYTVEMRTPVTPYFRLVNRKRIPANWDSKFSSNAFTEGYVRGNPQLIHSIYLGVNGCGGVYDHPVEPIMCVQSDRAPLGEGPIGSHPLGSDIGIIGLNYFNEIYTKYRPILNYYFIGFGILCTAKNHSYQILSLGANLAFAPNANNSLINIDPNDL